MAKRKWTPREIAEIFSKPFHCFPPPKRGERGPGEAFWPVFVNDPIMRKKVAARGNPITLKHRKVIDLLWGSAGAGKTQNAVGLGLSYAINFPGSIGLVGGKVFDDIRDNVIRLYKELLTINEEWDHPLVVRHPSGSSHGNKELVLKVPLAGGGFAYSVIKFMHFKEWQRLRGRSPDWIHFEEMSQMDDPSVLDELDRRCRGSVLPIRHVFCTTNPPEDFSHFIYEKWSVRQFQDGYDGPRMPMGKPCTCQFCQDCLNDESIKKEFPYGEDGFCTNPNCATLKITGQRGTKDYYTIGNERLCCQGNEEFWRAFLFKMSDNPHLPMDQQQSNKAGTDDKTYQLYSEGKVIELRDEYCYPKMNFSNITLDNLEIDPDLDIILACDANTKPQCSLVIQEDVEELHGTIALKQLNIIDEIVVYKPNWRRPNPLRPGAGPADVAYEFIDRHGENFNKERTIWLWGDPNAHGNTQDPFQETFYAIVHKILTEEGYRVRMGINSAKGNNKFPVIDKVANTNWLLEDHLGTRRIKMSPRCEYLIMALQENKWDPSGKASKDKSKDRLAFKAKTVAKRPLTHITDALDAYIAFKFYLIERENVSWFAVPGEFNAIIKNGRVIKEEHPIKRVLEEQLKPRQVSLKDIVDTYINEYREEQDSFFGYFL